MARPSARAFDPGPGNGVAAVVLAAGGSTRMGAPKQLLPLREGSPTSLLRHAACVALEAGCRPVVVVLGAGAETLREELRGQDVVIAENPDWTEGLASSIRVGVEAARRAAPELSGLLVTLADQPAIDGRALAKLLAAFSESGRPAASAYANTLGAPAVFPRRLLPALSGLRGDHGARALLRDEEVIPVPLAAAARDIDTAADYRGFLEDQRVRS